MKKNSEHIKIRETVEHLMYGGFSIEEIAKKLALPIGSRYIKKSAKWYRYCIIAKQNQRKAIELHPNLYSRAGKIAQERHPQLGHNLGKKYGLEFGRKRAETLRGNSEYFTRMATKLHQISPEHSRENMKRAHQTMKREGTFYNHQRKAALRCLEKNPNQLKEMSKKAHSLYPLALLALNSRRKNRPYEFMGCLFDSKSEMKLCELFVKHGLIDKPEEGKNIHFKLNRRHIDFFINGAFFIEFHPPLFYVRKKAGSLESYYDERRRILDEAGYQNYPLIVINKLKGAESKIENIKLLFAFKLNQ